MLNDLLNNIDLGKIYFFSSTITMIALALKNTKNQNIHNETHNNKYYYKIIKVLDPDNDCDFIDDYEVNSNRLDLFK